MRKAGKVYIGAKRRFGTEGATDRRDVQELYKALQKKFYDEVCRPFETHGLVAPSDEIGTRGKKSQAFFIQEKLEQAKNEYSKKFLETLNDYMQIFKAKNIGSESEAIKHLLGFIVDESSVTYTGLLRDSLKYASKEFAKELFEFSLEEYSEKISFRLRVEKVNTGLLKTSIDKNDKRIIRAIFLNDIDIEQASDDDWKKLLITLTLEQYQKLRKEYLN